MVVTRRDAYELRIGGVARDDPEFCWPLGAAGAAAGPQGLGPGRGSMRRWLRSRALETVVGQCDDHGAAFRGQGPSRFL